MKRRAMYFFAFMVCGAATLGLFVARGPEPSDSMLRHRVGRIRTLSIKKSDIERRLERRFDIRRAANSRELQNLYEAINGGPLNEHSQAGQHVAKVRQQEQARAMWDDQLQQEIDGLEAEIEAAGDETAIAKAEQEDLVRRRAIYTGAAFFTGIVSATFLILFLAIKNPRAGTQNLSEVRRGYDSGEP